MKQMVTNGTYTRTHTDWLVVGKGRCRPNGRTRRRFTETGMPRGVDSAEGFEGLRDGLESSGQESTCGINFFGNFSKGWINRSYVRDNILLSSFTVDMIRRFQRKVPN